MPKETLPKFYNVFCIKLKVKWKAHFQQALAAQTVFEKYGRKSKREQFLDEMNEVVPWSVFHKHLRRVIQRQAR